jgi:hypothetical protein
MFETILSLAVILIIFGGLLLKWWENNKGVQATLYLRVNVEDTEDDGGSVEPRIGHGETYSFYMPMLRFPSIPRVGDTVEFGDIAEYIVTKVRLIDKVNAAQIICEEFTISPEEIPGMLEAMKIEGWGKKGHYDPNKTPKDYLEEIQVEDPRKP